MEGASREGALWGVGRSPQRVWRRGGVRLPSTLRGGVKLGLAAVILAQAYLGEKPSPHRTIIAGFK